MNDVKSSPENSDEMNVAIGPGFNESEITRSQFALESVLVNCLLPYQKHQEIKRALNYLVNVAKDGLRTQERYARQSNERYRTLHELETLKSSISKIRYMVEGGEEPAVVQKAITNMLGYPEGTDLDELHEKAKHERRQREKSFRAESTRGIPKTSRHPRDVAAAGAGGPPAGIAAGGTADSTVGKTSDTIN